ncbi:TonB-dependent receptor plug domain-containing protein [Robertkochia flava]|uniref:TonB-dependent receptor plug domain-containing protein n=1 Tax=Robertkochia flava TaxID=3447986 RepID=UPI001CCDCDC3|nr:TonB-dependent receptor [Robertkochia marina]
MVLSASKWEEAPERITQRVEVISKEEVLFSNAQTSADLLQSAGNVFVQKSQLGGGSPMIRGFSTNRLLIVVDGVRMNNAIFRGGNLQNVISIDPLAIGSSEIIFGPGSVTYGSDAIGGVMSFFTVAPEIDEEKPGINGRALVRYASANTEKTAHTLLNYNGKKWGGVTAVSYSDFDDLVMGSHGPEEYLRPEYVRPENGQDVVVSNSNPRKQVPTGYGQVNLLQKFTFLPWEHFTLKASLIYTATGDYDRYDRLIRYRNGLPRAAEWYYGPQKWLMANVTAEHKASGGLYDHIRFTNAYQRFNESRHDRDFGDDLRFNTMEEVHAWSSNLDLEKDLGPYVTLHYGAEFIYNAIASEGYSENIFTEVRETIASRYPDGSWWSSLAAYANFDYHPDRRINFRGGIRYNYIDIYADFRDNNVFYDFPFEEANTRTDALTGSAGVHWRPSRIFQARLQASTAFRAPNIDDIGKIFDSEPGSVVVPNPGLKPEYAYNMDLGFQLNLQEKLKLDISVYRTWLKDAMVRRDFTYDGRSQIEYNGELSDIQAIQNASKARVYGFEAGASWRISNTLHAKASVAYVKGVEELDDGSESPLRHAAPLFANANLEWKKDRIKLDLGMQYNAEVAYDDLAVSERGKAYIYAEDANGNPFAPSWYTLNFRGAYELFENTRLQLALENFTDQRYRTYSSGIAAPGINLILALRQTF